MEQDYHLFCFLTRYFHTDWLELELNPTLFYIFSDFLLDSNTFLFNIVLPLLPTFIHIAKERHIYWNYPIVLVYWDIHPNLCHCFCDENPQGSYIVILNLFFFLPRVGQGRSIATAWVFMHDQRIKTFHLHVTGCVFMHSDFFMCAFYHVSRYLLKFNWCIKKNAHVSESKKKATFATFCIITEHLKHTAKRGQAVFGE